MRAAFRSLPDVHGDGVQHVIVPLADGIVMRVLFWKLHVSLETPAARLSRAGVGSHAASLSRSRAHRIARRRVTTPSISTTGTIQGGGPCEDFRTDAFVPCWTFTRLVTATSSRSCVDVSLTDDVATITERARSRVTDALRVVRDVGQRVYLPNRRRWRLMMSASPGAVRVKVAGTGAELVSVKFSNRRPESVATSALLITNAFDSGYSL